jgi:hypothetical protein
MAKKRGHRGPGRPRREPVEVLHTTIAVDLMAEIRRQAEEGERPLNRTIERLLWIGIEAEHDKEKA